MFTSPLFRLESDIETSDDYWTPAWIFERLDLTFDIDVAAPPGGVPWIPAARHFTIGDDGLSQPWEGLIWCNPPYSTASGWVKRMADHRNGVMLLPFVDSNWLDIVWNESDGVALLPRDMPFVRPSQKEQRIMFRTALWAFGTEAERALSKIGSGRIR